MFNKDRNESSSDETTILNIIESQDFKDLFIDRDIIKGYLIEN
ncbi:hypothetical protein [Clostridium yunnanense]|nr:hypothetical protein [Clostridium yunnanense]